jgi:hypothetical protein
MYIKKIIVLKEMKNPDKSAFEEARIQIRAPTKDIPLYGSING